MDAFDFLQAMREKQRRLRALVEKHQQELREVSTTIACLERELPKMKPPAPAPDTGKAVATLFDRCDGNTTDSPATEAAPEAASETPPKPSAILKLIPVSREHGRRISLAVRRAVLADYLRANGPSPRAAILEATKIPPGSLSVLLARGHDEGWLSKTTDGKWGLKEPA